MKNRIIIAIVALIFGVFMPIASQAGNAEAELQAAAKEYDAGNNAAAIELYNKWIKEYGENVAVMYNLGNAYTRQKEYGPARLWYERAHKLDPSNEEVENNLSFVTTKVDIQNRSDLKGKPLSVTPDDPWFFQSIYGMVAKNVKSDSWALMAGIAFVLFIFLLADYIFTKQVMVRKLGFFGGIIMLGLSALFLVFSFCAAHELGKHDAGVITASKVELLAEPSDNAKTVTTPLNAGTKVDIQKIEGGTFESPEWYQVRLNSDFTGWVKADKVAAI